MRQPPKSKIQLTSSEDRLEIIIPARFRPDKTARHLLCLVSAIDLTALLLIIISIFISIQLSIPQTDPAVKVGLGVCLMIVLPLTLWTLQGGLKMSFDLADQFLSHTKVKIDRRQFTLSEHLYSLERSCPKHLKTYEITQAIVDTYQQPNLKAKKVTLMLELREIDPIRLFSSGQDLTEREIKWLAIELSNWLGINLSIDPTDLDKS